MKLDELDDRFVPAAAAWVGRIADRFSARRDRVAHFFDGLRASSLRDLDARFAASGPLALLREVPQIGFVVIALIFIAGAGTAVSRENALERAAQQAQEQTVEQGPDTSASAGGDDALGPEVGQTTTSYESATSAALARAEGGAGAKRLAFVSLADYRTPTQATTLFAGVSVQRVYLRARAGGKDAAQLPVEIKGDLLGAINRAYTSTARLRLAAQKSYQGYVDSLEVTTQEEQAFKDLYAAFARSTGIEAREFGRGCACVYAAVVQAGLGDLQKLRARPGVRAVELADADRKLSQLQVLPLLPEIRGVVPKQQSGADPQP